MASEDKKSGKAIATGIVATLSGATPAAGNIVDLAGFEAATLALMTGAVTDAGAAAGFTVKIQHSDTTAASDFEDCVAAEVIGGPTLSVTSDTDDSVPVGILGYVGNKRYVRCVATGTTGTDAVINGVWVLECARFQPVPDETAANIAAT